MTQSAAVKVIDAAGLRIHVRDEGRGEPVLFLHGNPDSGDLWSGVIDRLDAERWRSIAPDLPGFGRSEVRPETRFDLPSMSRFIDSLLEALGLEEPVHLVMHDFGGPYGMSWAVEHPERVRSLTMINAFFFSRYRWHFWARVWRTPLLGELCLVLWNWWLFKFEMRRGSQNLSDGQLRAMYRQVTPPMKRTVLRLYRETDPENFRGYEERLLQLVRERPSMVLWGVEDPYFPKDFPQRYGADQVELFSQSGHWLPAEFPEPVAERLTSFYERIAADSAAPDR